MTDQERMGRSGDDPAETADDPTTEPEDVEGHSWATYEFGKTVAGDRSREAQEHARASRLGKESRANDRKKP